jgi:hypothetical protein
LTSGAEQVGHSFLILLLILRHSYTFSYALVIICCVPHFSHPAFDILRSLEADYMKKLPPLSEYAKIWIGRKPYPKGGS